MSPTATEERAGTQERPVPAGTPAPDREEVPIVNPDGPPPELRKEWVTIRAGRLCVWELDTATELDITAKVRIQAGPQAGQINRADSLIWQILKSCKNGDGPNAQPIWREDQIMALYRLPSADTQKIVDAIARVNGADPEDAKALEGFTSLPTDGRPETSPGGVPR